MTIVSLSLGATALSMFQLFATAMRIRPMRQRCIVVRSPGIIAGLFLANNFNRGASRQRRQERLPAGHNERPSGPI